MPRIITAEDVRDLGSYQTNTNNFANQSPHKQMADGIKVTTRALNDAFYGKTTDEKDYNAILGVMRQFQTLLQYTKTFKGQYDSDTITEFNENLAELEKNLLILKNSQSTSSKLVAENMYIDIEHIYANNLIPKDVKASRQNHATQPPTQTTSVKTSVTLEETVNKIKQWPASTTKDDILAKVSIMQTAFSALDSKDKTALEEPMKNCIEVLDSLQPPKDGKRQEPNAACMKALTELDKTLPLLMKNQNPEVKAAAWSIWNVLSTAITCLAIVAAVVVGSIMAIAMGDPTLLEAASTMSTSLGDSSSSTTKESAIQKVAKAMDDVKNTVSNNYKEKLNNVKADIPKQQEVSKKESTRSNNFH